MKRYFRRGHLAFATLKIEAIVGNQRLKLSQDATARYAVLARGRCGEKTGGDYAPGESVSSLSESRRFGGCRISSTAYEVFSAIRLRWSPGTLPTMLSILDGSTSMIQEQTAAHGFESPVTVRFCLCHGRSSYSSDNGFGRVPVIAAATIGAPASN